MTKISNNNFEKILVELPLEIPRAPVPLQRLKFPLAKLEHVTGALSRCRAAAGVVFPSSPAVHRPQISETRNLTGFQPKSIDKHKY